MKYWLGGLLALMSLGCKEVVKEKTEVVHNESVSLIGHWDNFLQYWLENTATDMHRVETDEKHRHLSLEIREGPNNEFKIELREGRNGKTVVDTLYISNADLNTPNFTQKGDTLYVTGLNHFENTVPYRFVRTRKFSGWIELPLQQYPDSIHRKSNLEIHDQGGMVEIDFEGKQYTAELTQLLFGKKLAIMKLAIYDMPLDSVQINSRSISYT